jgi:hypothetical protein
LPQLDSIEGRQFTDDGELLGVVVPAIFEIAKERGELIGMIAEAVGDGAADRPLEFLDLGHTRNSMPSARARSFTRKLSKAKKARDRGRATAAENAG